MVKISFSHFDTGTRRDTRCIIMLDLAHLGYQVSRCDHPFMGIATGQDQFKPRWLHGNQVKQLLYIDQTKAHGTIDLIQNNEIVGI